MSTVELEKRVSEVERRIAGLAQVLARPQPQKAWESTIGMFAERAEFKEIVRLGREYREKQRKQQAAR